MSGGGPHYDEDAPGYVPEPRELLVDTRKERIEEVLALRTRTLAVVLDRLEDTFNMGAVLRSADAAGVSALIVADGGTDLYNPAAIRASLGTIFTVPVGAVSSQDAINWLHAHNLAIYAARLDAATTYIQADFTRPCAIVLGSEASGLTDRWSAPSDTGSASAITPIKIPMLGVADSLNVSAAAAVLFYEAQRQRRTNPV